MLASGFNQEALRDRPGCPLCEASRHTTHIGFDEIPVVRCGVCGFLYSKRVLTPEAVETYYGSSHETPYVRPQTVNARVNHRALRALLPLAKTRSFLDVGAGYGLLLKTLQKRYGMSVAGVELSRSEARYARDALGLDVRNKSLSEAGFAKGSFDVAACFEVLEHTLNPIDFLRQLIEHVRPGGHVLVMTDNFEAPVVRRMGAWWPKWIPHTHVSHFASETLLECFRKAGSTEVVSCLSYTPWENLVKAAATGSRSDVPSYSLKAALDYEVAKPYPLYHLRYAFNPVWFELTRRRRLGGSLNYVVARKLA